MPGQLTNSRLDENIRVMMGFKLVHRNFEFYHNFLNLFLLLND